MTDETPGSADAGNSAAAAAAAAGQSAAAAAGGAQAQWYDAFPEDLKGLVLNKGWDTPDKAVVGYKNLESYLGADKAGRGVILPGDNATPEERAAFNLKLGVPLTADAYELPIPAEFPDPNFGKQASELFLKHGIPKANGQALIGDFMKLVQDGQTAESTADTARFTAEEAALKDGWGPDFDKNIEIAKRGAKKLGFTDDVIDALETKAGFAGVMKALHQAGVMIGEGAFVDGGGDGGSVFGETLDQLTARRSALVKDKGWAQRFHQNDASARKEYDDLNNKIAKLSGVTT